MIITMKALIARINRQLTKDSMLLRKTRGERAKLDLGEFYVHDYSYNIPNECHVDPEEYGRELGVLC